MNKVTAQPPVAPGGHRIPTSPGRYRLLNPTSGRVRIVRVFPMNDMLYAAHRQWLIARPVDLVPGIWQGPADPMVLAGPQGRV